MKNIKNKIIKLVSKGTLKKENHKKKSDNVEYLDPAVAFFMSVGKKYGHNFSVDQVEKHSVEDLANMPLEKDNPFLNRRILFYRNTRK